MMAKTVEELPEIMLVADIQEYLDISKTAAYDLVKSGSFHTIRIGRNFKIPKKPFVKWLEGNSNE
ncbi:MAG: helix-turn-helix domain-containing protein [Candidatus Cohnella colombiensis]|uniref:Helix-turn-helix domain-containing protein n=1 Tax=Candidatus Cohnella colombiensis TaxID=3121368 RepID=A0AA95F1Z9_9BACL|nr:MAG: helix-turn-helix domain-containing protein [Cohnella sp.]